MQKKNLVSVALVAVVFACLGWFGSALTKADYISPGESIAACWTTHVTVLSTADGRKQDPNQVVVSARHSLDALSRGLATYYDRLPERTRAQVATHFPRATTALDDNLRDPEAITALDCLERAQDLGEMDAGCINASVTIL